MMDKIYNFLLMRSSFVYPSICIKAGLVRLKLGSQSVMHIKSLESSKKFSISIFARSLAVTSLRVKIRYSTSSVSPMIGTSVQSQYVTPRSGFFRIQKVLQKLDIPF